MLSNLLKCIHLLILSRETDRVPLVTFTLDSNRKKRGSNKVVVITIILIKRY